jgi:hypothetical protein
MSNKFNKKELEFFLPDSFKGLSKKYLLDCIFDEDIQQKWSPQLGDVIIGCTGNIFVIGAIEELHEKLGGREYFFGGGSCNRDGGGILDSTFCYTANESGKKYHPLDGEIEDLYHSSIRDFKFVPYPHELEKLKTKQD